MKGTFWKMRIYSLKKKGKKKWIVTKWKRIHDSLQTIIGSQTKSCLKEIDSSSELDFYRIVIERDPHKEISFLPIVERYNKLDRLIKTTEILFSAKFIWSKIDI